MNVGGWLAWSAGVVCLATAAAGTANAQISVYADFSAAQMTNLHTTKTAFGTTFGVQGELYRLGHARIYGDVQGFYYNGQGVEVGSNRLQIGGLGVGPKVGYVIKRAEPYAEFRVGFARYNDGLGNKNSGTTDNQVDAAFGLDYRLTRLIDYRVAEFDYKRYAALGGEFNPKVFSTGIVYHIGKR